ncbi:ABC transporter permease [Actinoplanes sp. NBRC 14428]|uniref:ABC-2 family transporter n=1 Tax=Pseudosporangium ferrugineum TaxID=439699 RepID=A0A2T0SDI2_9ACTN|nr:ABC transporter permease [Pseudosporangium ferrugineum]PRY31477.1 ABC-2 family transporter [Pseudosporangium ferrugineum]BCJ54379.1 ABC transporter permease [Actinoplanes sp. NBRC 14428]
MNLVRAELLKIRTTNTWWIFGLIALPLWALTLLVNWASSSALLGMDPNEPGLDADQAEQTRVAAEAVNVATNLYTSGQFFGVLVVLLLAAIVVTNEFFHQTATTTFLVTPRREAVVLAKLAASVVLGLIFWLVTTLLNLALVPLILNALDVGVQLGEPAVWRAIGLNALAYALWAVLGVGAGVLIRSQIGATITLSTVYVIGFLGAATVFALLTPRIGDWFGNLQVLVPPLASQLMIAGTELPGNPPRWVGAVVLIGYALLAGGLGTWITKKRDIT